MIFLDYPDQGPQDPYWSYVVLLLHGDGSNGGTIIDSSSSAHTMAATGTPAISTSNPEYGSGSLLFDGTRPGYVSTASSGDFNFGSGDFTVEFSMANLTWPGIGFETPIIGVWSSATELRWLMTIDINNHLTFYYVQGGVPVFTVVSSSGVAPISTYKRIAATRSGTTLRLFIEGAIVATATIAGAIDNGSSTPLTIGGLNYAGPLALNARLDEVRITKGIARYTAAYTPATSAFPNG